MGATRENNSRNLDSGQMIGGVLGTVHFSLKAVTSGQVHHKQGAPGSLNKNTLSHVQKRRQGSSFLGSFDLHK